MSRYLAGLWLDSKDEPYHEDKVAGWALCLKCGERIPIFDAEFILGEVFEAISNHDCEFTKATRLMMLRMMSRQTNL